MLADGSPLFYWHWWLVLGVKGRPLRFQIVTGSFDKTVKVWDATTGKEIRTLTGPQGHKQMVLNVAISPDGSLIASGSSDNTANLWD